MSKVSVCDLCETILLEKFNDKAFKIIKVRNAYDGYAPFRRKRKLDLCEKCFATSTTRFERLIARQTP